MLIDPVIILEVSPVILLAALEGLTKSPSPFVSVLGRSLAKGSRQLERATLTVHCCQCQAGNMRSVDKYLNPKTKRFRDNGK